MAKTKKTTSKASKSSTPAKKTSCWKIGLITLGVIVVLIILLIVIVALNDKEEKTIEIKPTQSTTNSSQENQNKTNNPITNSDKISEIKINDQVDSRGVVITNKSVYTASTPEINVSAYLTDMKKGVEVSSQLMHVETQETSQAVTNITENDGDIISNFSFGKPPSGWPIGNYRLIIVLSTGEKKETTFSVK